MLPKGGKGSGATFLRGGAFKPRTSPYSFQGLKSEGLDLLKGARKATGLPIVTEIMSTAHIDMFESVDIIQVGARNMQNFELLKQLGKIDKPILLKKRTEHHYRGMDNECRIHHGRRQRTGNTLRKRHTHLRDLHQETPSTFLLFLL